MDNKDSSPVPDIVQNALHVKSVKMPEGAPTVTGYDFNKGVNYDEILQSLKYTGFQGLHFGQAVDEIKKMLKCRDEPLENVSPHIDDEFKPKSNCTIFLGFTSNMVSSGIREVIRFLVQHKLVDVLVTTAGAIEEDIIKCMASFYLGDFKLKGADLRMKGLNRTGNLIVPNDNYVAFENWFNPLLDQMLKEQVENGVNWTPSRMIARMGKEINNPDSVWYWAYKNDIPVFCPAITDGAIGDNVYFHRFKNPGFRIDIAEDIFKINNTAVYAKNSGMVIIGGGVIKHHICNANIMRNGADFSVYINTANEFDGSDAGASADEAVSWGKIKMTATPVKIVADATVVFPLLVAETFAKHHHAKQDLND